MMGRPREGPEAGLAGGAEYGESRETGRALAATLGRETVGGLFAAGATWRDGNGWLEDAAGRLSS